MTEYQQFIVLRHSESLTNAINAFQAGNQYARTVSPRWVQIRRNLEARAERLIVVDARGVILKVWFAHLMFTAIPGLDTPTQVAAYRGFIRLGSWNETPSPLPQVQGTSRVALAHDRHSAHAA
jgi:hypothetical protein